MKHNPNYLYMFVDEMPCIASADQKNWIFITEAEGWKRTDDNWDALYPNYKGWWTKFDTLPELPDDDFPTKLFKSGVYAVAKWAGLTPSKGINVKSRCSNFFRSFSEKNFL